MKPPDTSTSAAAHWTSWASALAPRTTGWQTTSCWLGLAHCKGRCGVRAEPHAGAHAASSGPVAADSAVMVSLPRQLDGLAARPPAHLRWCPLGLGGRLWKRRTFELGPECGGLPSVSGPPRPVRGLDRTERWGVPLLSLLPARGRSSRPALGTSGLPGICTPVLQLSDLRLRCGCRGRPHLRDLRPSPHGSRV